MNEQEKQNKIFLIVGSIAGIIALLLLVRSCCVPSSPSDGNLDKVLEIYKKHAKSGSKDIHSFEKDINLSGIYNDVGYINVDEASDGGVIGYADKNGNKTFNSSVDELIFKLEVDQPNQRLVARNRHHHYSHIGVGDIMGFYLISSMMSRHHGYYGGYRGYDYSRGRASVRRGSYGGRSSRSRGGSGGWGFGK